MKSGVFQDAVESSTKVFGRKNDVAVVFEGSSARTDGGVVYLPSLPPSAEVTVDQANVIRGFRDHEAMHVRCTDTSPAGLAKLKAVQDAGNKHRTAILQYCEDARIERAGVQEYVGMRDTLSATNTRAAQELLEQIEQRGDAAEVLKALPKPLKFRMMLSNMSRAIFGIESGGVYEAINEHIKADDPSLHALASKWAQAMADLPTGYANGKLDDKLSKQLSHTSFDLADQIFKAYEDYEMNPPPPPEPDDGDGDDEGDGKGKPKQGGKGGKQTKADADGGDGEGDSGDQPGGDEGSGDSDSDQGGDGSGGDGDGDGDGSDGDGGGDSGGGPEGNDNDADCPGSEVDPSTSSEAPGEGGNSNSGGGGVMAKGANENAAPIDVSGIDVDDLYNKALDSVVGEIVDDKSDPVTGIYKGSFRVFSNRLSVKAPISKIMASIHGDSQANMTAYGAKLYAGMKTKVDGKKAMIRRILELELMARSDRHWESGHKAGRLQSVRLVQAIQGRETVYQKRKDGKDMDTLLKISIDSSGSMSGSRQTSAALMAYALSDALERTGCDIEVLLWGDVAVPGMTGNFSGGYTKKEYDEIETAYVEEYNRYIRQGVNAPYVSSGLLARAVVKQVRQRMSDPQVQANFGIANRCMSSGTPSLNAIFADLTDMAREQYGKKIYLHLTDGQPNPSHSKQPVSELMAEAHKFAKSIGVHMIGVGIAGMNVSHMFNDHITVQGADAFEPVVKHLAKLIAKESGNANRRAA